MTFGANGVSVNSGNIGTGYKVNIKNSSETRTLTVVIYGDTSGDGVINALDLLQVQKNILGTYSLSGAYSSAGDTSKDGTINALDLLQVQKNIYDFWKILFYLTIQIEFGGKKRGKIWKNFRLKKECQLQMWGLDQGIFHLNLLIW